MILTSGRGFLLGVGSCGKVGVAESLATLLRLSADLEASFVGRSTAASAEDAPDKELREALVAALWGPEALCAEDEAAAAPACLAAPDLSCAAIPRRACSGVRMARERDAFAPPRWSTRVLVTRATLLQLNTLHSWPATSSVLSERHPHIPCLFLKHKKMHLHSVTQLSRYWLHDILSTFPYPILECPFIFCTPPQTFCTFLFRTIFNSK